MTCNIIIDNAYTNNQFLLNNADDAYSDAIELPGGEMNTFSIVAADVNGDIMMLVVDIVVGNQDQNNRLLINDGDGTYSKAINLPGGEMSTESIVAADMNGDGMVIFLLVAKIKRISC